MRFWRAFLALDRMLAAAPEGWSASWLEWELGWKPLLSMMGLMAVVFAVVSTLAALTM